jgi:hypothetical protein
MIIVGLLMISIFVLMFFLHEDFLSNLIYLKDKTPAFLNRFGYLILAFGLSRERIFRNNSMETLEEHPYYGRNIDLMYNDISIENEKQLVSLKSNYKPVLKSLIDQLHVLDS